MKHLIENTALILEGGGMRATYTGGMLSLFIDKDIYFPYITGISAGTTLLTNLVLRDTKRLYDSFVTSAADPDFAGMSHFLRGQGFFNSFYIYEEAGYEGGMLEVDWEAWQRDESRITIGAFDATNGRMKYWHKEDIHTLRDLMRICRASSSLPVAMPPTYIDGICYMDGGIADSFGLDEAEKAGYEQFVILPTHVRGFRREPFRENPLMKAALYKYPSAYEGLRHRAERYNAVMEHIDELEREGRALVLYPDEMPLSRSDLKSEQLHEAFWRGRAQAERDFDSYGLISE